jgi:hypothetical protein
MPRCVGFFFSFIGAYMHRPVFFFQGGIDNGLLRGPKSGSLSWMTTSDGEAAVAFMHILLGCFVGTRCFRLLKK